MRVYVNIEISPDDVLAHSPDQTARKVLTTLGGNLQADEAFVTVTQTAQGHAGLAQETAGPEAKPAQDEK